jgi:hypothetical protein
MEERIVADEVAKGQVWYDQHGTVRVMAVAEGYVMARRPRCSPFVDEIENFGKRFRPEAPATVRENRNA